jgi:hypothetical protein
VRAHPVGEPPGQRTRTVDLDLTACDGVAHRAIAHPHLGEGSEVGTNREVDRMSGIDETEVDGIVHDEPVRSSPRGRAAEAELDLEIAPDAGAWRVWVRGRLQPRAAVDRAGVFVALYQNGLFSHVTAGENAARQLRHDRVTRELVGPLPVAADGGFAHPHRFRPPADADPRDLGIAAFVQDRADGHVWQALALALAACPE